MMKDQKQKAKIYLLSELGLDPEDADALVSMASISLTLGDLELSTHCLLRAVDIDRANADAYYYLGVVTANRGRLEESVEFLAQALQAKPDHIAALRDLASVYLALGRLADARETINRAETLPGDDANLKALARRIYLAQKMERIKDSLRRFCPRFIVRKLLR
jgi:tetratricopeptide (TPR) repeat protein